MQISKSRWEWLIREIDDIIFNDLVDERTEITTDELTLVLNVLRNNVPFEVVEDNE